LEEQAHFPKIKGYGPNPFGFIQAGKLEMRAFHLLHQIRTLYTLNKKVKKKFKFFFVFLANPKKDLYAHLQTKIP